MLVVKRTKNIILILNSDAINTVIRYLLFRLCMRERRGGRKREREVLLQKTSGNCSPKKPAGARAALGREEETCG